MDQLSNENIQPAATTEQTPDVETGVEQVTITEVPKEVSIVQEQPAGVPVMNQQTDDQAQAQPTSVPDQEEISEELSSRVGYKDVPWVKKADQIKKEYGAQPYKEEEAVEDLQVEYMDKRFGVKINKDDHLK